MPTIRERGDSIQVIIRKGQYARRPLMRTFPREQRAIAEQWGNDVENGISRGALIDHHEIRATSVADLLNRFNEEVVPGRKGHRWEGARIGAYLREPWAHLTLDQNIPEAMRKWRDARLAKVNPRTVIRDFALISSVFTHAITEWGVGLAANPMNLVKRPPGGAGGAREVTWTDEQLDLFLKHLGFNEDKAPTTRREELAWIMVLLRHTGLRRGTLLATRREWVQLAQRVIFYPDLSVKNGEPFKMPVGKTALHYLTKLLALLPDRPGRIFAMNEGTMDTIFNRDARGELIALHPERAKELRALRVHDLRHTFTTNLVEGAGGKIDNMTLLRMTGRKDLRHLVRYYNPKAATMADMIP